MRRYFSAFSLVMFIFLALVSCTSVSKETPTPTVVAKPTLIAEAIFPQEIKDDAGRLVSFPRLPSRIVSLAPSNTEILFALGLANSVVGVDEYSNYPPEAASKEKVGGFAKVNLEKVVALDPDLVLATNLHTKSVVPELERRGLKVVVVEAKNIEGVLERIVAIGGLTGRSKEAAGLVEQLRRRVEVVVNKTQSSSKRPRVFFEISADLYTAGPGSFVEDLILKAGGSNIAADAKTAFPQLNLEVLVQKDPEVILLADAEFGETPDKVASRPGWQEIKAVKEKRVFPLNPDLVNRPGPRVVEGLEIMAKALHPELFP